MWFASGLHNAGTESGTSEIPDKPSTQQAGKQFRERWATENAGYTVYWSPCLGDVLSRKVLLCRSSTQQTRTLTTPRKRPRFRTEIGSLAAVECWVWTFFKMRRQCNNLSPFEINCPTTQLQHCWNTQPYCDKMLFSLKINIPLCKRSVFKLAWPLGLSFLYSFTSVH